GDVPQAESGAQKRTPGRSLGEPAREELQTYLSSFAEWTASLERETRNLRVPLLESPHPHSMTPNWLIATSLVEKSGMNGSGWFNTFLASMRMVSCLDSVIRNDFCMLASKDQNSNLVRALG